MVHGTIELPGRVFAVPIVLGCCCYTSLAMGIWEYCASHSQEDCATCIMSAAHSSSLHCLTILLCAACVWKAFSTNKLARCCSKQLFSCSTAFALLLRVRTHRVEELVGRSVACIVDVLAQLRDELESVLARMAEKVRVFICQPAWHGLLMCCHALLNRRPCCLQMLRLFSTAALAAHCTHDNQSELVIFQLHREVLEEWCTTKRTQHLARQKGRKEHNKGKARGVPQASKSSLRQVEEKLDIQKDGEARKEILRPDISFYAASKNLSSYAEREELSDLAATAPAYSWRVGVHPPFRKRVRLPPSLATAGAWVCTPL
eukprot:651754-Pelagomonas_calceolata.AAC.3